MRKDYDQFHQRKARPFQAFEAAWHGGQMSLKMIVYLIIFLSVLYFCVFSFYFYRFGFPPWARHDLIPWGKSLVMGYISPLEEYLVELPCQDRPTQICPQWWNASDIQTGFTEYYLKMLKAKGKLWLAFYPVYLISSCLGFIYLFYRRSRQLQSVEHIRGGRIVSSKELRAMIKKEGKPGIAISKNLFIPMQHECKHAFIIGATGTGKSMVIKKILQQIRSRDERAVIFDVKGEYISHFLEEQDIIYNPLDSRSVRWSIVKDLQYPQQADDFVSPFFSRPVYSAAGDFFVQAARQVMAGVLRCAMKEKLSNEEIARVVFSDFVTIHKFLKEHGDIAASQIPPVAEKQAAGVQSTLAQHMRAIELLCGLDGDFSFRRWVRQGQGFLYLPLFPAWRELLSPLITFILDLISKEILSLPDDPSRRIWLIIDELGALKKMKQLIDFITLARSKGGCMIVGVQDYGKIDEIYGRSIRETLWNNSFTKLILRVDAPSTAQYLSQSLGQAEVEVPRDSFSMGVEDYRDGMSITRQEVIKPLFLPSEIQNLPDLQALIKIGHWPVATDEIPVVRLRRVAEEMVFRHPPTLSFAESTKEASEGAGGKEVEETRAEQAERAEQKEHKPETREAETGKDYC